ncbi:M48 family metalloprotease [bacterium]|nr:M48 family metalloprotease [bacterium]
MSSRFVRHSAGTCFVIAAIVLLAAAPTAQAKLSRDRAKATFDEFNAQPRGVRPEFLAYPNYTLLLGEQDYVCHIPRALRRLGAAGETFRLRKLRVKHTYVELEVETLGKTRLKIVLRDRSFLRQEFLDDGVATFLNEVFDFGPPPPSRGYVGNSESRLVHFGVCNHLPASALRVPFATHAEAAAAGYRDCPVCFTDLEILPFPNYVSHRTSGLTEAHAFELVYPRVEDAALQARLDGLGRTVLDGWPLEPAGFDYEFRIVHADMPLAASFRTGIVIVSDMLLAAAESDEEILLVLAHEIAHCELHLPPRSPFESVQFGPLLAEKWYTAFHNWNNFLQMSADLVALYWFQVQPEGAWDIDRARAALAKVQFATGETDRISGEGGRPWGLHDRLQLFNSASFRPGNGRSVTVGYDGEEDVRYVARLLGLLRIGDSTKVLAVILLETTDYTDEATVVSEPFRTNGYLRDADGTERQFTISAYLARPNYATVVIGTMEFENAFHKFRTGATEGVVLHGLRGVKNWRVEAVGGD